MTRFYTFLSGLLFLFSVKINAQLTIAQWDFNNSDATPTVGAGTITNLNGVTATYSNNTGSTDTNTSGKGYNTLTYAALGTENKQRGIQINLGTVTYYGITLTFDQRLSNTANNTYVVQYTTDVSASSPVWVDAKTFTFTPADSGTGDVWYNNRTVDFSSITGLNNNANVAFRIVSAFDPTTNDYLAATSGKTYATTGTVRYDMLTFKASISTLGINDVAKNESFVAYPNPVSANGVIYFNQTSDFTVYSIEGKKIKEGQNQKSFSTEKMNKGIYIINTPKGNTKLIVK